MGVTQSGGHYLPTEESEGGDNPIVKACQWCEVIVRKRSIRNVLKVNLPFAQSPANRTDPEKQAMQANFIDIIDFIVYYSLI
jgi:hypothetical protein